jgi:hypothetical protein
LLNPPAGGGHKQSHPKLHPSQLHWCAAERAANVARTERLEHVRGVALPALTKIADPDLELSDADRGERRPVEAQLRDEIRGRVLTTDEVVAATRRPRNTA